ncbi:MAG: DUF5329 domain-containing protein [Curvibacter sp.]|nr:DUF5329 domain-containing protein [Curvibacter sp.]
MPFLPHVLRRLTAAGCLSLTAALLLSPAQASADPASPAVRAEIEALLIRLEQVHCEFYRNGDWHSGAEAHAHLQHKLDYLQDRITLESTEQFIELAASKSSWSGTPYQVRCGKADPQPSAQWLRQQLQWIRSGGASPRQGGRP